MPAPLPRPTLLLAWTLLAAAALLSPPLPATNAIGTLPGDLEVSTTGAASYRIPLFTAAGANGLRPELALAWHSRAGDGPLGIGWRLDGLSQITRCPRTIATHGEHAGIAYDGSDRYCLDGMPLLAISGSYGAHGTEYRTELHAQQRVRSFGSTGSGAAVGPNRFEVDHPGGLLYIYGGSPDSRPAAAGRSDGAVRAWGLREIRDRFGARIRISYLTVSGEPELLPGTIRWTIGSSEPDSAARYRLLFEYQHRPVSEGRSGQLAGSPWSRMNRISRIRYQFRDQGTFVDVHRYTLAYEGSGATGRSRLASVTQCGPAECLPPTVLSWSGAVAGWGAETTGPTGLDPAALAFGDFNGDGATDLLAAIGGSWQLWLADPATGRYGPPRATGIAANGGRAMTLDYDGDGLSDLMLQWGPDSEQWRVYTASAAGTFAFADDYTLTGVQQLALLDADGDGRDDLLLLAGTGNDQRLLLMRNEGSRFGVPLPSGIGIGGGDGSIWSLSATGRRADFDGDGRHDLLLRVIAGGDPSRASYRAHRSTGNGFEAEPLFTTAGPVDTALLADVNGDGLTDLLYPDPGTQRWQVLLSRGAQPPGTAIGAEPAGCPSPPASGERWWQARIVDHDGDGRADLLLPEGSGWRVYLSDGACYHASTGSSVFSVPLAGGSTPAQTALVTSADLRGDGRGDLLLLRADGALRLRLRQGPVGDLLARVSDGLGNQAELEWAALAGSDHYHLDTNPGPDPEGEEPGSHLLHGGPLQVVTAVHRSDGQGGSWTTRHRYWNARRSLHGRGFLGFARTRQLDERDGSCREQAFLQRFPFAGQLRSQIDYQPHPQCADAGGLAGLAPSSDYEAEWVQHPASGPGPRLVHRREDLSRHYEVGSGQLASTTRRRWQYDPVHAAATEEVVERSSPLWPGSTWRQVTSLSFAEGPRNQYWCLGLPTRIDVRREQPGSAAATRSRILQYDANSRCRPRVELQGPPEQVGEQLKTTWTRDISNGRITSVEFDSGSGLAERRRLDIGWDAWGLRPVTMTPRINGQPDPVLELGWHYGLGLPVREVDARGHVTLLDYDDFGRLRQRQGPGGSGLVNSRQGCGDGGCWAGSGARYRVRAQRADGYWTETQYDGLERVVGEASRLPDGAESRREQAWDAFGHLRRETQPYLAGDPRFWIEYTRDLRGRITMIDQPASEQAGSGRVTRLSYAPNSVTVEDPAGRRTTQLHDPEGRLVFVQAPLGGGAAYSYTPFGELASIWDAGWNETRLEYDARGRLARLDHPDSGAWHYTWNVFGELVSQRDDQLPAGAIDWDYDQLGRLRQRSEREGITRWDYHQSPGGAFGLLREVTGPTDLAADGYRESWQYDAQSQPLEVEVSIDGHAYLTSRRYDALGRLSRVTYPASAWGMRSEFIYAYADSGHLRLISQAYPGGWQFPTYEVRGRDALGRAVHAVYGGEAVDSRRDFDRAHLRPVTIRSTGPGAGPLQDYRYTWDAAGNLESRRDVLQDLTEGFTHDALDRLIAVTRNGQPTLALDYAPNGNLLSKSDAGSYSYLAGRPRAVSRVSGGTRGTQLFGYDGNGNMTSRNGGQILWTSFNLPREINRGGSGCSGDCSRFAYGPDRQRIKQQVRSGNGFRTVHYVGRHFEAEYLPDGNVRYQVHLPADGSMVLTQRVDTQLNWESWFLLRDHLGSVDRLVRDFGTDPAALHPLSFDAFGKRRFPDWSADSGDVLRLVESRSRRGFTDQEQLERLGLVHMNGRVLDPLLGRMLSPDPVLGQPLQPQSLNAYSYAWNAPLRMIDPSGHEAVDFNNFRPDPVHFQHSSMNDAFGRAAELWTAGWATLAIGGGSSYLATRAYQGYLGINPAYRELLLASALEIAQGVAIASQPLDQEIPQSAPLPEPIDIQRPDDRDPREQYPVPPGSSWSGLTDLFGGGLSAWLPPALSSPPVWSVQYSFFDGSGLTTRVAAVGGNCRSCHGGGDGPPAALRLQPPLGQTDDTDLPPGSGEDRDAH